MDASRLLLVEDDAVSAAFLADALASLPAIVHVAGDIAEARRLAAAHAHALLLVDAHLPDGDGLDCLRALRECTAAPALALTAGAARGELDALCAAGYLEVLMKPVSVALLQASARRALGLAPGADVALPATAGKLPVWEDARALAAIGGKREALLRLRGLFLDELPGMRDALHAAQAAGDRAQVAAIVHKLRASCGFVGAARVAASVEALAAAPLDAAALRGFDFAIGDALATPAAQP